MKIWTWKRLEREFEKFPDLLKAVNDHPPKKDLPTFEEVLQIDDKQVDIFAKVMGCNNADNIRVQQHEVMDLRKAYWKTPREWIEAAEKGPPIEDYDNSLRKITRRYVREKLREGDFLGASVKKSEIILKPKRLILRDQEWFWTKEWQKKEREADEDIKAGRLSGPFTNAKDLIVHLKGLKRKKP